VAAEAEKAAEVAKENRAKMAKVKRARKVPARTARTKRVGPDHTVRRKVKLFIDSIERHNFDQSSLLLSANQYFL